MREAIGEHRLIAIDEIQKLPALMDEVHSLIESHPEKRFILTGSSARKLKTSHTSLMAGRARTVLLHPFVSTELQGTASWTLNERLLYGCLPPVVTSEDPENELKDYAGDYLREEIAAEGAVRNLIPFSRFLQMAATCQAQLINFEKIGSDTQIPGRTIREYFHVLEDTLIAKMLPPFRSTGKRKPVAKSKFYFFDIGVCHSLLKIKSLPEEGTVYGTAFESLVYQELRAYLDYTRSENELTHWRTQDHNEVDFVIGSHVGIEVKSSRQVDERDLKGMKILSTEAKLERKIVVSRDPIKRRVDDIEIWPINEFLESLWRHEII